jgi:hypothetical protein
MYIVQASGELRVAHGVNSSSIHFERVLLGHQFWLPIRAVVANRSSPAASCLSSHCREVTRRPRSPVLGAVIATFAAVGLMLSTQRPSVRQEPPTSRLR